MNCNKEVTANAYELFNIMTNKGDIVTSEDQVIQIDSNMDAIELFVTEKTQDNEGIPNVIGPAYVNNFEDF